MYAVKKPDKVDPNETRLSRWTTCALSFEPLKPPCVMDQRGNVFNKEPLVEALLGKKLPKEFGGHIKGLKDMIPIHLSRDSSDENSGFQCPITGLAFNEFSESDDKIPINGTPEEVAVLREKMEVERAAKSQNRLREKKEKKKIKVEGGVGGVSDRLSGTKHGKGSEEKVVVKNEAGNGKLANGKGGAVKRLKSAAVPPPNATKEVYASIFISSRKSDFKETYSCRSLPLGRN